MFQALQEPIILVKMRQQQATTHKELQIDLPHAAAAAQVEVAAPHSPRAEKEPQNGIRQPRVKSQLRIILIGLIISFSALMLGYSMKEITSVPIDTIITKYDVTQMGSFEARSLLIGILPVGSVLGVLISVRLIHYFRRLTGIYIFTLVNIVAILLVNQLYLSTLVVGRFIEGICIGFYAYIAPAYLKEIAPKEMRRLLGLFFSLGKIIGVMIAIILELVLQKYNVDIAFRIILSMTGVFSLLQAVLIYFFGSNTPTEMLEKGQRDQAKQIIRDFYPEHYVDEIFNEYVQEYLADMHQGEEDICNDHDNAQAPKQAPPDEPAIKRKIQSNSALQNRLDSNKVANETNKANNSLDRIRETGEGGEEAPRELTFQQKKFRAYMMAVQMCALRQFCGGNVLLVQGGLFVSTFNESLGYYTPVIINSIQFFFILVGIFYIQKVLGKRPLFLFSLPTMAILNFIIVVLMIFEKVVPTLVLMSIFMMVFGGSFININWAIPPELAPARELLVPNIVHWLTLSIANLVPPLVSSAMPNNNPYPVFIFFGLYDIFGFIHVKTCLQETDGRTYMEIVKSFK